LPLCGGPAKDQPVPAGECRDSIRGVRAGELQLVEVADESGGGGVPRVWLPDLLSLSGAKLRGCCQDWRGDCFGVDLLFALVEDCGRRQGGRRLGHSWAGGTCRTGRRLRFGLVWVEFEVVAELGAGVVAELERLLAARDAVAVAGGAVREVVEDDPLEPHAARLNATAIRAIKRKLMFRIALD
jgi:hypothetical protein